MVRDERVFGLTGKPAPVVYVPMAQGWFKGPRANYSMEIAVRTEGDPLALAKPVQAELRALDPDLAANEAVVAAVLAQASEFEQS